MQFHDRTHNAVTPESIIDVLCERFRWLRTNLKEKKLSLRGFLPGSSGVEWSALLHVSLPDPNHPQAIQNHCDPHNRHHAAHGFQEWLEAAPHYSSRHWGRRLLPGAVLQVLLWGFSFCASSANVREFVKEPTCLCKPQALAYIEGSFHHIKDRTLKIILPCYVTGKKRELIEHQYN